MKISKSIIILAYFTLSIVSCVPRRKKCATIKKFHRTGEAISIDNLIKQYEKEHQQFYKELGNEGDYLQWPVLDNKDLSNYCKKYLQCAIPTRTNDGATGCKMRQMLYYEKENTSYSNKIVIVQCKIIYKAFQLVYYMTRAPEPNCVYALKCSGNKTGYRFVIIHKHCDFEEKPLKNMSLRRKMAEVIGKIHRGTGQPIAKDKYLLKYELEHQEMLNKQGEIDKHIEWPHAMEHHNLNSYCYQYIMECCPSRNPEGVLGSWSYARLYYEKLKTEDVDVTIIKCALPFASSKLHYNTTRAPENNCVYTLLRKGHSVVDPLIIIFKHCDFENPPSDQQVNSKINDIPVKTLILKTELKEETPDILEALPLFPEN